MTVGTLNLFTKKDRSRSIESIERYTSGVPWMKKVIYRGDQNVWEPLGRLQRIFKLDDGCYISWNTASETQNGGREKKFQTDVIDSILIIGSLVEEKCFLEDSHTT